MKRVPYSQHAVAAAVTDEMTAAMAIVSKADREAELDRIKDLAIERVGGQFEGREKEIGGALRSLTKKVVRQPKVAPRAAKKPVRVAKKPARVAKPQLTLSTAIGLKLILKASGKISMNETSYQVGELVIPKFQVVAIAGNDIYYRSTINLGIIAATKEVKGRIVYDLADGSKVIPLDEGQLEFLTVAGTAAAEAADEEDGEVDDDDTEYEVDDDEEGVEDDEDDGELDDEDGEEADEEDGEDDEEEEEDDADGEFDDLDI